MMLNLLKALRCLMSCSVFNSVIQGGLALVQLCQRRAELSWLEREQMLSRCTKTHVRGCHMPLWVDAT